MPAFREYKMRHGHLAIPDRHVHRDGTVLGMLVRHITKGLTDIPDSHFNELVNVLGFRLRNTNRARV